MSNSAPTTALARTVHDAVPEGSAILGAYLCGRKLAGKELWKGGASYGTAAAVLRLVAPFILPKSLTRSLVGQSALGLLTGVAVGEAAIRGLADRRNISVAELLGLPTTEQKDGAIEVEARSVAA